MVGTQSTIPQDERKFVADALIALGAAILMRYDGTVVEKDAGAAHLAAQQTKSLLAEYRALKNGDVLP